MNEQRLRRLLRRVLLSAPLPLAVLGAACGGSSIATFDGGGGSEAGGAPGAGANNGGAPSAGASNGGALTVAGAPAGGAGGAIAVAGAGGSIAGGAGAAGAAASSGMGAGGSTGDACKTSMTLNCNTITVTIPKSCIDTTQAVLGTQLSQETCKSICNVAYVFSCSVVSTSDSSVGITCNPGCAVGRRPAGMLESGAFDSRAAGGYFAQIAELEAASVVAFRILRDELRAAGAPPALVRAAARAARDEVRHARATGALARRFGGTPRAATVARSAPRSLEAMAVENAVEGCVRETYGALLATRQAQLARDPVVRAAMTRIARDETRHASLSWRVGRWLAARLTPAARRHVEQAQQRAARELQLSLAQEPECAFADVAGLPSPAEAVQLAEHLQRLLWS